MRGAADEQFARRIGALLIAEHDPGGGRRGGTAAALTRAEALFRTAGADTEALSPTVLLAVFDHPANAVNAATGLHLHAARRAGFGRPAEWRIGVDVGTVVLRDDPTTVRGAVERASALAGVARVGTTAVMHDALSAIGRLRNATIEDLLPRNLPGVSNAAVRLIVPRRDAALIPRRRVLVWLAGTAALGGAGGLAWITTRAPQTAGVRHVTLGVGPFRSPQATEAGGWIGPALRDGLNTQLSELSGVRVFSDEFLDFLMSREGVSSIELATRLGIQKMVSGTVVVVGDTVRVEARIVDVASGLFEGAAVASGREEDFLALESEVVVGVIEKLGLQLTAEDRERLDAQRTADLEARRRLFRVEGEEEPPEGPPPTHDPDSRIWDNIGPSPAYADDADAEVAAFLERYRRATEAGDLATIGRMYVEFSPGQRAALVDYYASVRDLQVGIGRLEVGVVGDEAVVSYTRNDNFVDVSTNRRLHVSARVTKTLRRVDGDWRFMR